MEEDESCSIPEVYEVGYGREMEKEEPKFAIKCFWMKDCGSQKIQDELLITLGDDAQGRDQIWLQKFTNGDSSCRDLPPPARPPLTLGCNLRHFYKSRLFLDWGSWRPNDHLSPFDFHKLPLGVARPLWLSVFHGSIFCGLPKLIPLVRPITVSFGSSS
jgi:hypothetical protein